MLELEDFIAETMISIVRGIQKGQESEVGEYIAPLIQGSQRNDFGNFHLKDDDTNQATVLQFEVSVSAKTMDSQGETGEVKAKLFVVDIGVGGDKKSQLESSSLQKLKFAIPITIPKRT